MRVNPTRGLAVIGLCLVLVAAPAGQAAVGSQTYQAPRGQQAPPPPPPRDKSDHSGLWIATLIALGAGAAVAAGQHDHQKPPDAQKPDDGQDAPRPPDRTDLLENGPHVSDIQPLGLFAAYGFVRRGWPIVVDYETDPGSTTFLSVTIDGREWRQYLRSGRHSVMAPYDGAGAPQSTPALFAVRSVTRAGDPSPVDIHGLGAGPQSVIPPAKPAYSAAPVARLALAAFSRDVGSPFAGPPPRVIPADFEPLAAQSTIRDLRFVPASGAVGGAFAEYRYQLSAYFSRVRTEVLFYGAGKTADGRPLIKVTPVTVYPVVPMNPGPVGPRYWDGRVASSRKPSHGPHRLQVSGWRVDGDETWVTEYSTADVIGP